MSLYGWFGTVTSPVNDMVVDCAVYKERRENDNFKAVEIGSKALMNERSEFSFVLGF